MPDGSNFDFFEEESELPYSKIPPFLGGWGEDKEWNVLKWSFQQISIILKLKMCF